MSRPIVIAAGGTGGHLFPARALAGVLARAGRATALVTDVRGATWAADFAEAGTSVHVIRAASPTGRGPFGALLAGVQIAIGALQARRLLRRLRAPVVVGFGGYPSLPTALAARGAGAAVVLHEQNAVLGRVNRLLQGRARALALSFEKTLGVVDVATRRLIVTGNPVRAEFAEIGEAGYRPPEPDGSLELLVFGGSQGARRFAEVVPEALARLDDETRGRLNLVQQARTEDEEPLRARYRELGIRAEVRGFFDDMGARIAAAHLVVARAGAGTLAELTVAGRPAILVPYPHATDDHQSYNAAAMAEAGGAVVYNDGEISAEELAARIESLGRRPDVLARMAERSRSLGRDEAADTLASVVRDLAPAADGNGGRVAA